MRRTFGRGSHGRLVGLTGRADALVGEAVSADSPVPYILMVVGVLASVAVLIIAILVFINCNRIWIKHHPSNLQTPLDQLGSFIGGISVFFATVVAWITAFLITWRNSRLERRLNAVNSIRAIYEALYEAFWKPKDIAVARKWIISEDEYAKVLKPVLENRNRSLLNHLDKAQNDVLDTLDKMLAVLVRIKSFVVSEEIEYLTESERVLSAKGAARIFLGQFCIST
jgi:hypothetical protein